MSKTEQPRKSLRNSVSYGQLCVQKLFHLSIQAEVKIHISSTSSRALKYRQIVLFIRISHTACLESIQILFIVEHAQSLIISLSLHVKQ